VVRDREFLGREHRYRLQLPSGIQLQARTYQKQPLASQTRVRVTCNDSLLHLFPSHASEEAQVGHQQPQLTEKI
jgi:iron(III) transport system ATP-binding protein